MTFIPLFQKIGINDMRLIGRDSFLKLMLGFVVLIALFVRFGLPALNDYLQHSQIMPGSFGPQPLSDYFALLIGYLIVFQGALLSGAIYGFLILDEKEDNTLVAMQVTPVPTANYIATRMYIPALAAWAIISFQLLVINIVPLAPIAAICIGFGAGFTAPIATLTYANFAQNKLQGFAIAKFVGVAGWIILIGWFVPPPFQWLFGLFPPFLVSKAYWLALEGSANWGLVLLIAIILQSIVIWILALKFSSK